MSKIALSGDASGTGTFTIASPNSNSNFTLTLPANTGTVLTSATTTGFPAGSVLQVVSAQITAKTTVSVTTAGTFYDISGYSATITPSSASNKILFMAMVNHSFQSTGANRQYLRILRGSTAIGIGDVAGSQFRTTTNFFINDPNGQITQPLIWLDSPNTTSATTYKVQVTSNANSQTACFNRTASDNQDDMAVTAAQILLLEVAA